MPVGIRAEAQFFVINDGYDNLELKVSLFPFASLMAISACWY